MWLELNDIELNENVYCDARLEFRCTFHGSKGDFWEPGDGPEFEVEELYVTDAWNECWDKNREELGGWAGILDARLEQVIDWDSLYDRQCDELANFGDY